jgi:hypothetical protein
MGCLTEVLAISGPVLYSQPRTAALSAQSPLSPPSSRSATHQQSSPSSRRSLQPCADSPLALRQEKNDVIGGLNGSMVSGLLQQEIGQNRESW